MGQRFVACDREQSFLMPPDVREWLPPLQRVLGSETEATLLLAALRGLVLDLLATGDAERVDRAFEALLASV